MAIFSFSKAFYCKLNLAFYELWQLKKCSFHTHCIRSGFGFYVVCYVLALLFSECVWFFKSFTVWCRCSMIACIITENMTNNCYVMLTMTSNDKWQFGTIMVGTSAVMNLSKIYQRKKWNSDIVVNQTFQEISENCLPSVSFLEAHSHGVQKQWCKYELIQVQKPTVPSLRDHCCTVVQ